MNLHVHVSDLSFSAEFLYDQFLLLEMHTFCTFLLLVIFITATVMVISFQTDRSRQTVQTQIRLLLREQSEQGLQCLQFHLHLFDEIP